MSRLIRQYTDVNGNRRVLEYIEDVPYLMNWLAGAEVPSTAKRWRAEDNSILTIPDNWWAYLNVQYEDMRE